MKKLLVELTWDDDDLGQEWMNIYNLELCLYSKEHTKRALLKAEVHTCSLPISIQEALNSGDGTYRP